MKTIDKTTIAYSVLSNKLFIARFGKNPRLALERREAHNEVLSAVALFLSNDAPKGSSVILTDPTTHRKTWVLSLRRYRKPARKSATRKVRRGS